MEGAHGGEEEEASCGERRGFPTAQMETISTALLPKKKPFMSLHLLDNSRLTVNSMILQMDVKCRRADCFTSRCLAHTQ